MLNHFGLQNGNVITCHAIIVHNMFLVIFKHTNLVKSYIFDFYLDKCWVKKVKYNYIPRCK